MFWRRRRAGIFRYWGGRRRGWINGDPIQIALAIQDDEEYAEEKHEKLLETGDPEATRIFVRMVCRAFDVELYSKESGRGLLISELMQIYYAYKAWAAMLKKNMDDLSKPPPSTESTSSPSEKPIENGTLPYSSPWAGPGLMPQPSPGEESAKV